MMMIKKHPGDRGLDDADSCSTRHLRRHRLPRARPRMSKPSDAARTPHGQPAWRATDAPTSSARPCPRHSRSACWRPWPTHLAAKLREAAADHVDKGIENQLLQAGQPVPRRRASSSRRALCAAAFVRCFGFMLVSSTGMSGGTGLLLHGGLAGIGAHPAEDVAGQPRHAPPEGDPQEPAGRLRPDHDLCRGRSWSRGRPGARRREDAGPVRRGADDLPARSLAGQAAPRGPEGAGRAHRRAGPHRLHQRRHPGREHGYQHRARCCASRPSRCA